jgi:FG-GAP repeat
LLPSSSCEEVGRSEFCTFVKLNVALTLLTCAFVPTVHALTTPPADITITGESAGNDFGWRAVPAGDVNGDGVEDLIVGARRRTMVSRVLPDAPIFFTGRSPAISMLLTPTQSFRPRHLAII